MFVFVNVEFVYFNLIIEMIVDFKRRDINNIKGKITLF